MCFNKYGLLFILLATFSFQVFATHSVCGVPIPKEFTKLSSASALKPKMPHAGFTLKSLTLPFVVLVGEKKLDLKRTQEIQFDNLENWAKSVLKKIVDRDPRRSYSQLETVPFSDKMTGVRSTLQYKIDDSEFFEQNLYVLQSETCAIDFLAISPYSQRRSTLTLISHFYHHMLTHSERFYKVAPSFWNSNLAQANQIGLLVLSILSVIAVGVVISTWNKQD